MDVRNYFYRTLISLKLGEDVIFQILQIMVQRNILTNFGSGYHKNKVSLISDAIREEIEDVLKSFLRIKKKKKKSKITFISVHIK